MWGYIQRRGVPLIFWGGGIDHTPLLPLKVKKNRTKKQQKGQKKHNLAEEKLNINKKILGFIVYLLNFERFKKNSKTILISPNLFKFALISRT